MSSEDADCRRGRRVNFRVSFRVEFHVAFRVELHVAFHVWNLSTLLNHFGLIFLHFSWLHA